MCQHPKTRVSHRIGVDFSVGKALRSEARFNDIWVTFIITSSSLSCASLEIPYQTYERACFKA